MSYATLQEVKEIVEYMKSVKALAFRVGEIEVTFSPEAMMETSFEEIKTDKNPSKEEEDLLFAST